MPLLSAVAHTAISGQVINAEVSIMLAKNIIERSHSPWASPVVLLRKKDSYLRSCIDYRHLNMITKKYVYPLPCIGHALDCFLVPNSPPP